MKLEEYMRPQRKTDGFKKQAHIIRDEVLLGSWSEVKDIDAEELRKWSNDPDKLDGLIIKGYEMKFGKTNENGERYEPTAFADFIQSYFVDGKLDMPVDINHEGVTNWQAYCGRVLYIEVNSVGFYFVVYIPKTYAHYADIKWALENHIIQGFSKEGFVSTEDYDVMWKEDGTFDYELIHRIAVVSVSLVCTPANGIAFEKMEETRNALMFANKIEEQQENATGNTLMAMFNN